MSSTSWWDSAHFRWSKERGGGRGRGEGEGEEGEEEVNCLYLGEVLSIFFIGGSLNQEKFVPSILHYEVSSSSCFSSYRHSFHQSEWYQCSNWETFPLFSIHRSVTISIPFLIHYLSLLSFYLFLHFLLCFSMFTQSSIERGNRPE